MILLTWIEMIKKDFNLKNNLSEDLIERLDIIQVFSTFTNFDTTFHYLSSNSVPEKEKRYSIEIECYEKEIRLSCIFVYDLNEEFKLVSLTVFANMASNFYKEVLKKHDTITIATKKREK